MQGPGVKDESVSLAARVAPSLRRLLRALSAYAVLLTLAAPAALGPATGPLLRELAEQQAHLCKCGMTPGKCGCPECERLERARQQAHAPEAVPTFRRDCDDDAPSILLSALPVTALAAKLETLPVPRGERVRLPAADAPPLCPNLAPPTPPPRLATA
jgi:hypothetical protein